MHASRFFLDPDARFAIWESESVANARTPWENKPPWRSCKWATIIAVFPTTISIRLTACCSVAALAVSLGAQSKQSASTDNLQEQYNSAERLQQSGDLVQAAIQYRAFLAGAQGELAAAHAAAGDYRKAAALFSEALAIQPDSSELQLGYAKTALLMGDLPQAEKLARAYLGENNNSQPLKLAQGHQILGRALLKMNRDQEARAEMQEAVHLDPGFSSRYDMAVVCLDLDDEECATENFRELEQSFGDTPAIHVQIGLAYGNSDFTPQAVAEFRKVIDENPNYPQAHYSLAAALLSAGDDQKNVPEAEAELKKELAISPHDFLAYSALGKLTVTTHRYDEADTYLKRAASLDPGNPDAYLYLGQMYFETSHPAEAEAALRKAIKLTSDPSRNRYQIQKAHFLLGRVLMQEHRPDEAHAEMDIAKSYANRGLSHDKEQLAGLLNNSGLTGATDNSSNSAVPSAAPQQIDSEAMNRVRALEKQMAFAIADAYNNLGVISAASSHYTDALENFQQAAIWEPGLDGLDLNLGRAAFMTSNFAEAIPPLSRYIRSHPDDSGIRGALAMSEFMTHNYHGCLTALTKAGGEVSAIPQMQYIYAESLAKIGQTAPARERLKRLEAAHPEIAEVHRGLGEIAEQQDDWQQALKELNTANQLNGSDPETHFDLGKTQLEKGSTAGAIVELQTAVRLMPGVPRYHQELASAYERAFRMSDAVKERKIADQMHADRMPASTEGSKAEKNHEP